MMQLKQKLISLFSEHRKTLVCILSSSIVLSSVSFQSPSRHSQIPPLEMVSSDSHFLNRKEVVFPPSPTSPIQSLSIMCSLERMLIQEHNHSHGPGSPLCTHTSSCSPIDVDQEAACQKGNQPWELHNSRSRSIKKTSVTFGRGGEVEQKQCLFTCIMGTALGEITADQPSASWWSPDF